MARPSFPCANPADLQAPEEFLEQELQHGNRFPVCNISGPIFDALLAEAIAVNDSAFARNVGFLEVNYQPQSDETIALTQMMHRVALMGLVVSAREPRREITRLFKSGDAGIHVDYGFGNLVNLTAEGQRVTTHFDNELRDSQAKLLRVGDISVIPSFTAPYYLQSVPHEVASSIEGGLVLQSTAIFPLRDQRAGLLA